MAANGPASPGHSTTQVPLAFIIDANGTVPLGLGVKYEAEYLLGGFTHATMKANISKFLILLFVALLMQGCSTPGQRAISTSEDNRIRTLTEDRSTWVDSPFRSSPR